MDWKMFFGGVSMLVIAYFLRRLSIWAYGRDNRARNAYGYSNNIKDWAGMVLFAIGGLVVIFCSFASA